jgi:glycosyltransferase involved in cell wall biosynthesis
MFAVSNKVRQDEIRAGVPQSHIETLYMGVPVLSVVRSPEYCNELHPAGFDSTQTKIIITVARFFPEKGMKYVVNAAIRIIKENPSVLWWLVGDGPQRESFQAIAQQAGVTDRLLFLGTRNDVPCLMSRAYVNVLGSLFEGLGLSVLESATFGVPTIGTRVEGLNEAVLHGRTGILVSTESSEALADSVVKLLADVGLRNHLGQAAKDHVRAYFDSDRLIDNLLDIYESDLIQQNAR